MAINAYSALASFTSEYQYCGKKGFCEILGREYHAFER